MEKVRSHPSDDTEDMYESDLRLGVGIVSLQAKGTQLPGLINGR